MTTIQIELTDATAKAARDAGLLTAQALERLLNNAIRRGQAADSRLSIADPQTRALAKDLLEGPRRELWCRD